MNRKVALLILACVSVLVGSLAVLVFAVDVFGNFMAVGPEDETFGTELAVTGLVALVFLAGGVRALIVALRLRPAPGSGPT